MLRMNDYNMLKNADNLRHLLAAYLAIICDTRETKCHGITGIPEIAIDYPIKINSSSVVERQSWN